jgi:Domain of unknown function (DUF1918)
MTAGTMTPRDREQDREVRMRASPGDRIVVKSQRIAEPDRDCQVLEVGRDGGPRYRVRRGEGGHVALFVPGPDARVHHGTQATD